MKTLLAFALLALSPAAGAFHSLGLPRETGSLTFSPEFKHAYNLAARDQSNAKCIEKLVALLEEFTKPEEVTEVELTLGVIYSQRTGLVDPEKAVPRFTAALKHGLPPTVRTGVLIWRGNALEQQNKHGAALADYIRGLVMCTQFDLSHGWPPDPPIVEPRPVRVEGGFLAPPARQGPAPGNDGVVQSHLISIERKMLQHRYFLVDAVKRVAQEEDLDAVDLEKEIGFIVTDKRRATQILVWCQDKNERPWP